MRLIKYTHACVRLERYERALVIDPGTFSEPESLAGASAVLITHEHADHVDAEMLKAAQQDDPELPIYTHVDVVTQLDAAGVAAQPVAAGDQFEVGGFGVAVVGGRHADVYDGLPGCANLGFVVDGLYHPGDSVFVPDVSVETLLLPVSGPWLKLAEALDFVRAVRPARAFPIHDVLLSQIGASAVDRWADMKGETDYSRLSPGASIDL
jgi:L-ascorbate metabolism protein UlaG (beta-lactamase superfamily)